MTTYDLVAQAIREASNIEATYDGHLRRLTPISVGTKRGEPQGLFVQFAGSSTSGEVPGWKCLALAKLVDVRIIPGPPHVLATEGTQPSNCLDYVDVSIGGFSGLT